MVFICWIIWVFISCCSNLIIVNNNGVNFVLDLFLDLLIGIIRDFFEDGFRDIRIIIFYLRKYKIIVFFFGIVRL